MKDRVKSVLDKLLQAFKDGTIPKAVAYQRYPIPNIPCRKWSFLNQLLCFIYGTEDARGYRQWQEVNRYVVKGAKGFDILVPWIKTTKEDDKEIPHLKGFMCRPVFAVEKTEGEALDYQTLVLPEIPLLEKARSWGLDIKVVGGSLEHYGYFIPSRNEIGLATPEERTFYHECSHYADSVVNGKLKNGQDPLQEIVAELSAQVLCQIVGKTAESQLGNSYQYIESYAQKLDMTPYTAVLQVLGRIDKVLNFILGEEVKYDLQPQD